jgi:hypothetical protein
MVEVSSMGRVAEQKADVGAGVCAGNEVKPRQIADQDAGVRERHTADKDSRMTGSQGPLRALSSRKYRCEIPAAAAACAMLPPWRASSRSMY